MPAGGFRTFVAGEVLDEGDINDFLMQGILVFGGTAQRDSAITAPVEGQFAFLTESDSLTFFDGSGWVEYEAGFPTATISGTTGTPGTGTFTDSNSFTWSYYDYTGNGSITIETAGYADVLVVGGGGAGARQGTSSSQALCGGGGADVRFGLQYLPAGTHAITVGAGGSGGVSVNGYAVSNPGDESSIGSIVYAGGGGKAVARNNTGRLDTGVDGAGGGAAGGIASSDDGVVAVADGGGAGGRSYGVNEYDGITLNYNNSSIEYGRGGTDATPVANTGQGGNRTVSPYGPGAAGRVIVRVQV